MAPRKNKTTSGNKGSQTVTNKGVGSRVVKTSKQQTKAGRPAPKKGVGHSSGARTMAAAGTPTLLDGGEMTTGEGSHQAVFRKLTLQKHSKYFLKGSNKKVPKDAEYIKKLREEAKTYRVLNQSTIVDCSDGERLVYFIKGGMLAGMSAEAGTSISSESLQAINHLLEVYKPQLPGKVNSRHRGGCEAELKS